MLKFAPNDVLSISDNDMSKNLHNLLGNNKNAFYKYVFSTHTYTYFSDNLIEITGYTREELNEIGFPKIIEKVVKSDEDVHELHNGDFHAIEEHYGKYLLKTKNNNLKWVEDISFAFRNDNNQYDYSIGMLRDITQFNNLISKLYDEKVYFDSVLELTGIIYVLLDKHNEIKFINDKGAQILGYKIEELLGKNILNLIPKNNRGLFSKAQFFNENKSFEASIITNFGEEKIISWQFKEELSRDGSVEFKVCSGQDITFNKKQERIHKVISGILDASNTEVNLKQLYKFIHESVSKLMPAENFYISLFDKEKDLITFPYFVDQIDKSAPPKKRGKGLTEYVLRMGKPALINRESDEELLSKKEVELIGTPTAIWLGVPLKIQNNTIGVVVVQDYENPLTYTENERDILEVVSYSISRAIERKRVDEEKTVLIQKLKESNKSKDELFSLVSHDLRSPFNSLLGFSEILTSEFDTLTQEEMKEYLNIIYETSKNLYGMTTNLLQYSRFQLGTIEYNPRNVDFNGLIQNNINIFKGHLLRKKLSLTLELFSQIKVFADEDMINSVIQNLLSNSIKFTDKEGEIIISSSIINNEEEISKLEVRVKDNGIGMDKLTLEKIFNEHVRSNPGTDKEFGSGLGLLLVKQAVEKNKGSIKVESELGKGTTFIFTLPLAKEEILA